MAVGKSTARERREGERKESPTHPIPLTHPPPQLTGKNQKSSKGRKGGKKKITDPFLKKEWYDIKAPGYFKTRKVGKTLITRTTGTKVRPPPPPPLPKPPTHPPTQTHSNRLPRKASRAVSSR